MGEGTKYLWVRFKDLAGNVSTKEIYDTIEYNTGVAGTQISYVLTLSNPTTTEIQWTLDGIAPVGSNYRLKITNSNGEEIITKNQIPITQTSYTLTEEEAGKLSTNESYTITIELVDSTGEVLATASLMVGTPTISTGPQIGEGILTNEGVVTAAVAVPALTLFSLTGLYALIENKSPLTLLLLLFTTRKHKKGGKVYDKNNYKALALAEVEIRSWEAKNKRFNGLIWILFTKGTGRRKICSKGNNSRV